MNKLKILTTALLLGVLFMPSVVLAQDTGDSVDVVESARTLAQEKRKSKEARLNEIKEEVAARKLQIKQDVCEKKAAKLTARMPKISNNANRLKIVIDKHYERVQGFYESGQLTVTNYEELVEAIELAKANAEASLETVNSYEFEVDCESETVASELDSFRTAVGDARDDLKAYRKALVELISSLKSANASANREADSSTENEEEDAPTETEDNTGGETEE